MNHQEKSKSLYIHTEAIHNMTAPREVVPIIMDLAKPKSVLDVGCGTGTWLKAFEENKVADYMGVDGDHVDRSQLRIPVEKFAARDLRADWSLEKKFDLVISLEVAEHLPEASADRFVEALANHANETIVFSAAIPGQGGQNHVNEQWPGYWQQKFQNHGFYFYDMIRPLIWENEKVDWWYRQNIFLVKKTKNDLRITPTVHPELLKTVNESNAKLLNGGRGLRISSTIFLKALSVRLKNTFR